MRGQWFYSTDAAAKNYVWFHSVRDLVRRAIEAEGVDVVDLGPSGTDAFSELKGKVTLTLTLTLTLTPTLPRGGCTPHNARAARSYYRREPEPEPEPESEPPEHPYE